MILGASPLGSSPIGGDLQVVAAGGADGNASGSIAAITLVAVTGTGTGAATTSGALPTVALTAPAGSASASGDGAATVELSQITLTAPACEAIGEGGTYAGEIKLNRWYIKRDKRILIFNTAQEADDYIEAETVANEAIAVAQKTSRRARKRLKERVYQSIAPVESVGVDALAQLTSRYSITVDLPALIAQQDYARVMQIQALAQMMQDEDDIELLLMV